MEIGRKTTWNAGEIDMERVYDDREKGSHKLVNKETEQAYRWRAQFFFVVTERPPPGAMIILHARQTLRNREVSAVAS